MRVALFRPRCCCSSLVSVVFVFSCCLLFSFLCCVPSVTSGSVVFLLQISPVCCVSVSLCSERSFPIELHLSTFKTSYFMLMGPVGLGMYDTLLYSHMVKGVVSTPSTRKPPLFPLCSILVELLRGPSWRGCG